MRLLYVNVPLPGEVPCDGSTIATGISKGPVSGRVMVRRLNLDRDDRADRADLQEETP